MGGTSFSCPELTMMQRLRYDLTSVLKVNPAVIWFLGPPGSGRTTHVTSLCKRFNLVEISVVRLINDESEKNTDRGKILEKVLKEGKRAPDEIVLDLIKEAILLAPRARPIHGLVINNFPRSKKQAELFIKEIKDVDVIIYLSADIRTLMLRLRRNSGKTLDLNEVKKTISDYSKDIKEAISVSKSRVEKISTEAPVAEVKMQLERIIHRRTNIRPRQNIRE